MSGDIVFKGCSKRRKSPDSDSSRDVVNAVLASLSKNQSKSAEHERGRSQQPQQQQQQKQSQQSKKLNDTDQQRKQDQDEEPEQQHSLNSQPGSHNQLSTDMQQLPATAEPNGHHMVLAFLCSARACASNCARLPRSEASRT